MARAGREFKPMVCLVAILAATCRAAASVEAEKAQNLLRELHE
jgi:hypothetical protein